MDITFRPGDTIQVHQKIDEGGLDASGQAKTRIQVFEGVVLAIKNSGAGKSFTVRKVSANGVGVERIWPANSPWIEKIVVKKKAAKIRRAKLYYLRGRTKKQTAKIVS